MVYSIGHSNHPIETFLGLLARHEILAVVDVRSRPYSKWSPHFQKVPLSRSLHEAGVEYVFFGAELGGKPEGAEFYDASGRVDYARRAEASDFKTGVDQLVRLTANKRTAFMCAEEDPRRCHRHLLVTPALEQRGMDVVHIRGDGRCQAERELRRSSPQLHLFE